MSGHSKWSTIKHRKGAQDAKRGKVFTKLIKEITIAARLGGGELGANPRLRAAVSNAKAQSMPKDNIERAIKKGTGGLDGVHYEEIIFEGYGPNNVALIVEAVTDNRNRTVAFIRSAFSKLGGNLGATNSVQYMFDHVGQIYINKPLIEEEALMEIILEVGADDMNTEDPERYEVMTALSDFAQVRGALEDREVEMAAANLAWVPQNRVELDDLKQAEQVMRLIDQLEDNDDVQSVYSNFDISDKVLAEMSS